jgi:hypothetical protein
MTDYFVFDDLRSLKKKINEKAYDLFKEKPGTAPLQVTQIIPNRASNGEEKDVNRLVRDQDVWKLSEVKASHQVKGPILRESKFFMFDIIGLIFHTICCQ